MKTILILEDDLAVRESFIDFFEDRNWSTLQANSAEDALTLLKHESPVAAVVDLRLPGMDGTDFIRTATRDHPKMVFVLCTGSPEFEMPSDLVEIPGMSARLFRKPMISFADLENELLRIIDTLKNKEAAID